MVGGACRFWENVRVFVLEPTIFGWEEKDPEASSWTLRPVKTRGHSKSRGFWAEEGNDVSLVRNA